MKKKSLLLSPDLSTNDHELGHHFMDWLDDLAVNRPATAWLGTENRGETFVSWRAYCKVYFREWAIQYDIPRKRWPAIFREFIND